MFSAPPIFQAAARVNRFALDESAQLWL